MRALLALPKQHARALEADLRREYHGVDLLDRWRFDENGRRKLTIRALASFVSGLPPDSVTAQALGGDGYTVTDLLLMDVWQAAAQSKQPHPSRPAGAASKVATPEGEERKRAAKRRAAERRRAIEAGEIT